HPSLSTHTKEETSDEESFDPISKTPENSDDEGNGKEDLDLNIGREEGHDEKEKEEEEEEEDELYRHVNINQRSGIQMTQEVEDSHVTLTSINPDGQQQSSSTPPSVALLPMSAPTNTSSTIATITTTQQAPLPPTTAPSTLLQDLPNFGSLFGFDNRLKTVEANFSEFMQTNLFAGASDRLREEAQKENDEFLKTIDENMQKIIKEQVKEQVKTSYVVAANLSEMELKKILIEKMKGNKSIHRSNEQRNLYKALVEAYESDKIILDTYGDTVTLKRICDDDADKDKKPSAGPDRGSKRRKEGKEPESASALTETATKSDGKSTQRTKSRQGSTSESATAEEPMQITFQMEEPSHLEFDTGAEDQPIVQSSQNPEWFSQQQKPPTMDRDWNKTLSATHGSIQPCISELTKGASSHKYTTSITKKKAADYGNIKWIEDLVPRTMWIQEPIGYDNHALWEVSHWGRKRQQFYGFAVNRKSARDVYSKRRIIAVTELKIVKWHNYKHLDWIMVRRDDDKLYKFKEGDFKRLRIQDIKDMLLLLV
nr:hypothetical protein [Tanacetum cinerariifolium]